MQARLWLLTGCSALAQQPVECLQRSRHCELLLAVLCVHVQQCGWPLACGMPGAIDAAPHPAQLQQEAPGLMQQRQLGTQVS